jgi:hypothetical protein
LLQIPTPILVVLAAIVLGTMMWFLAGDRDPPPNAPENYGALRAKFLRTSRGTTALTFVGMILAGPLAFGIGYGRSLLLQAGVVLLGMVGLPALWVLYQSRSRNDLDIDEYLRFENLHAPFLATRPVQLSKWIIGGLLAVGLACTAALFVET